MQLCWPLFLILWICWFQCELLCWKTSPKVLYNVKRLQLLKYALGFFPVLCSFIHSPSYRPISASHFFPFTPTISDSIFSLPPFSFCFLIVDTHFGRMDKDEGRGRWKCNGGNAKAIRGRKTRAGIHTVLQKVNHEWCTKLHTQFEQSVALMLYLIPLFCS